jgi:hypothetical protein
MARSFWNLKDVRRRLRGNSLYLVVAVAAFGIIVFLLFRDRSSGPREAAAGEAAPGTRAVGDATESAPERAVETLPSQDASLSPSAPVLMSTQPQPQPADTAQPVQEVVSPANSQVDAAIAEVMTLVRSQPGEVIGARDRFNKLLPMPMTPQQRQTVKSEMAKLANEWLFGPAAFPGDTLCDTYAVKSGDLLEVIGRRHKVPYEILMQINHIPRPQSLQAGRAIKVIQGPFHVKVCRSTFTLDVYLQDTYVRSFKVGLGKPGHETPTGLWRVQENGKLVKPRWTDPDTGRVYRASDPDYPLGSRWIALDGVSGAAKGRTGFAIHGTKDPEQIGTAGSRGCIRMYNGDAILVYNLLFPLYSQVEVFD